ncbi:MAG: hypothetical protein JW795_08030, partial [Chitinivibrionales bacterium]|nr:hypothetical protein [Chitinivibrionales bacterium]
MKGFIRLFVVVSLLVAGISSSASAARFFTDKGSIQIGGGMLFETVHRESPGGIVTVDYDHFKFYPIFNYFVARYFYVGPSLSVESLDSDTRFDMGATVGFAFNGRQVPVIPFVGVAPQVIMDFYNNNDSDVGFGNDFYG